MENILVVGGAGYIGSHMINYLREQGYEPIVLDNFSTGHPTAVTCAKLIRGDMADNKILDVIFSQYHIAVVMHFASFIEVGESVINPAKYYQNNVSATFNLLQNMLKWNVKKIIFSSTAAVYGAPCYTPIDEDHLCNPINPYGRSKYMVEQILKDFSNAYDFQFTILRYFNAAGRKRHSHLQECHQPETHLIPLVLDVAKGKRKAIEVYGCDYNTPDGTCVRDYIHVLDLCAAHFLALKELLREKKSEVYNLGTATGYSVKQIIETARIITKHTIPIIKSARRSGDPDVLVANADKAKKLLQWTPRYSAIETIIADAWEGYAKSNGTLITS